MFYGLDWVATVPPTVRLAADAFGPERANVTFGWIFAAHQLGAACAAFGAGAARTELSSYLPALYVAGAACLIASALVVTLAQPRRRQRRPWRESAPARSVVAQPDKAALRRREALRTAIARANS